MNTMNECNVCECEECECPVCEKCGGTDGVEEFSAKINLDDIEVFYYCKRCSGYYLQYPDNASPPPCAEGDDDYIPF